MSVDRRIHRLRGNPPPVPASRVFADLPHDSGADPPVYFPWQGRTPAEGCVHCLRIMSGLDFLPSDPDTPLFGDVPLETWYAKRVRVSFLHARRRQSVCSAPTTP